MTTSTAALCSHNSSSNSSRLLVSLCFVYLEKSGHELQNGLWVALGLSSSGLRTPTVLVTSDRFPHIHPHREKKKEKHFYYSLIESQMAKKRNVPPHPLALDFKVEQIQSWRMKPNHGISLVSARIMIHPCKGQQGAAPAEHLHSTSVFSLSARSVKIWNHNRRRYFYNSKMWCCQTAALFSPS